MIDPLAFIMTLDTITPDDERLRRSPPHVFRVVADVTGRTVPVVVETPPAFIAFESAAEALLLSQDSLARLLRKHQLPYELVPMTIGGHRMRIKRALVPAVFEQLRQLRYTSVRAFA